MLTREALAQGDKAIVADATSPAGHALRGDALLALGQSTEAVTAYEEALTLPAMTPDGDAADLPAVTSGNVVTTSRVSLVQWVQENPGKTASALATLAAAAYLAYDYGKKDSGDTKVVPDPQVQEADTVVSIRGDNNTVTVDRSDNSQANTSTEAAGMP